MKRRLMSHSFILLVVIALILTACGSSNAPENNGGNGSSSQQTSNGASNEQDGDTNELSGELTVVTWAGDPFETAWRDKFQEFYEDTGVKVTLDAIPWENFRDKSTLEMASGSGAYDVLYVHPSWFEQYVEEGYLVPAHEYASQETLDLYVPSLLDAYTKDGVLYGLPDFITTQVLAYRTDLFEEKGLSAPESWDDIIHAAKELTDGTDMYGITFPARKAANLASIFNAIYVGNGGWYFDDNGNVNVNTPEAREAADFLAEISQYAPNGFMNFQWDENSTVAKNGRAAMALIMAVNSVWLDDENDSATAGKWAYVPIKSNKGTPGGVIDSYSWSVASTSDNKDAAAALVKFISGTEAQIYFTEKSGTSGATNAYYENTDLLESTPVLKAMNEVFENAKADPTWASWAGEREILESGLQEIMMGNMTSAELMSSLQDVMEANN